jgi:8-amino-3,8-dideoxy-alpha-D-manno-octulosonate transaminase
MSQNRERESRALQGSLKAVTRIEGKGDPKIGVEEFMSVAERFGFTPQTLTQIRAAVAADPMGDGPFLANYYAGLPETKVQELERVARESFGVTHAIGTSSGTGALHAAFVAAGVGPGTEVICPAIGFFATAAAVVMANGVPVFCDVDASLSMDPAEIEPLITDRTVALAPTCVMGSVPDMDPIMAVAGKHGLKVIEDCAQSCGGQYRGRYVGTIGDIGCFSISAYKIVGGGEGGLLLTDDQRLCDRANCLAEGGGLWRPERFAPPRYEGELFCGTNYRMSEIEAAVDVVQLRKMSEIAGRFRNVKRELTEHLETYREIIPQKLNDAGGEVGYTLRFYPQSMELGARIVEALKAQNVNASMRGADAGPDWHIYHWMFPLTTRTGAAANSCSHNCPEYRRQAGEIRYQRGDCPVADDLYDRMISISLNQWYTAGDCRNVAAAINRALAAFCREDAEVTPWR